MSTPGWPDAFFDRKAGIRCPQCLEGRPDETEHGVRFFAGASTDGYLQRVAPTLGYSVVVFRERHVADLQSMAVDELARFWSEATTVAHAIETVFRPVHLNLQVLGNADPHVHVHIVARHRDDPAPCRPLPADAWADSRHLTADELTTRCALLAPRSPRPAEPVDSGRVGHRRGLLVAEVHVMDLLGVGLGLPHDRTELRRPQHRAARALDHLLHLRLLDRLSAERTTG